MRHGAAGTRGRRARGVRLFRPAAPRALDILNVPYKGRAPALTDVLGGQVDLMFISLVAGTAQVQGDSENARAADA